MPYARSLQQYVLPEYYAPAPDEWVRRLRDASPELPGVGHLVFRRFDPTNPDGSDRGWANKDKPQWALYSAKDIRFIDEERAEQFRLHWSELPTEQQSGRRTVVSDYQHFMWHTQGLYVLPFLILQGPWGGTPAKYTEAEIAFLQGSDCMDEPFPVGMFPACPFDERVIAQIVNRDRLMKVSGDLAELEKLDSPDAKRNEDEAARLIKRQTCLDTWRVMIQPSLDFMTSFLRTKEADRVLPRAPEGTANAVGRWREHWLEHGAFIGASPAIHRSIA